MKVDLGFWNQQGEYIQDIQEIDEMELKRDTSDEEIIAKKGNTKCIFYSDDICRKGDKTRDCLNCARVEYQSLYSLNWDNQAKAEKEINRLEQENAELKAENERLKAEIKEKLEIYEKIKDKSAVFTSEFTLASGGVTALKEILELFEKRNKEEVNELEQQNKNLMRLNASSAYDVDNLLKEKNKYSQILQEIKEIIEDCNNGKCFSCEYNMEDAENCIDYRDNKIIDLITKAEEE